MKQQQPSVLKDLFPQAHNANYSDPKNAGGMYNSPSTDQSYINMVQSHTLLQTKANSYEMDAPQKYKQTAETSTPLSIDKPVDTMPKIPKGVFKNTFHNPNVRAASNYSVIEDLAQNPCVMLALELLHICPYL